MSLFQRLFGGPKKDTNETPEQAIQRLSSLEDMLVKKQEFLESQIETEKANALRCSKQGNKRGALAALKKKKQHEKNLLQIDGTLTTIDSQKEALQNAALNKEVFTTMKNTSGALKAANGEIDADTVHDLRDEMEEQLSMADEIANAISAPGLRDRDGISEDDLMRELEDLAQEEDAKTMIEFGPLPDVPITTTTTTTKTKEKTNPERELEEWLNG